VVTEPKALDDLVTEARATAGGTDHDLRSTAELVELMNRQDAGVPAAVDAARVQITAAIDEIAARLARGGRLIYVGAGSSGRIAALDAAECESTFSTEPGQVVALVAGGLVTSPAMQAAAEDGAEVGAAEIAALGAGEADAVVGVSASGRTPYVLGALRTAADAARSPSRSSPSRTPSSLGSPTSRSPSSSARSSSPARRGSRPAPRRSSS
jgi:N-acetylmuramic acid 6-phosphate etherase